MNKFIRERKNESKRTYGIYSYSKKLYRFILRQLDFFTIMMKNDFNTISSQAIEKQRMFIDPQAFIDMNEDFIDNICNKYSGFSKIKRIYCICI